MNQYDGKNCDSADAIEPANSPRFSKACHRVDVRARH
jgi:hypothetical protein